MGPITKFPIAREPDIPNFYTSRLHQSCSDISSNLLGPSIGKLRKFKINSVFLLAVQIHLVKGQQAVMVIRSPSKMVPVSKSIYKGIILRWRDFGQGSICCNKNTVTHRKSSFFSLSFSPVHSTHFACSNVIMVYSGYLL